MMTRRSTVDWVLHRVAAAEAGLTVRFGVKATGLLTAPGRPGGPPPRVTGVRTDRGDLAADLVVDATGRRSPIDDWLTQIGARTTVTWRAECGIAYFSRHYRVRPGAELSALLVARIVVALDEFLAGKWGGDNGAVQLVVARHAELPVEAIIGEIRDRIGIWRPLPAVTFRETAIDYLVHGQDIAVPLGRALPMPPGLAVLAADRVWASPRMFHARTKLVGYRLVAGDAPWAAGQGHEICGPIGALLLLLTGRPAALPQLSGPGAADLRELLTPSPAA